MNSESHDVSRAASHGWRARLMVRNSALNAAGQIAPLLVALPVLPYVLRGLGAERFAVLALAWTIIAYFGFFDLGMGRATTQLTARLLGSGRPDDMGRGVWTSAAVQSALGVAGAILIALAATFLARDVLRVADAALLRETILTFRVIAIALPLVMLSGTFSGVLEAHQRFDLVNLVRVPMNTVGLLIPAAGVMQGWSLHVIVAGIVASRAAGLMSLAGLAARVSAARLRPVRPDSATLRQLFAFGGWFTVSMVAAPIFMYAERLLIGNLQSLSELAYYAVPFEIVARAAIIPSAMAMTLFPAFGHAQGRGSSVGALFARPTRILLLVEWPVLVLFWLFPNEILRLWMGADVAAAGASAMRLLAAAFFFNAFAHIALAGVQGLGRPDLKAKFDMVQVPLYLVVAALLIARFGIAGAALAKLCFSAIDAILLYVFARRVSDAPLQLLPRGLRLHHALIALMILALTIAGAWMGLALRIACAVAVLVGVGTLMWYRVFEPADRLALRSAMSASRYAPQTEM